MCRVRNGRRRDAWREGGCLSSTFVCLCSPCGCISVLSRRPALELCMQPIEARIRPAEAQRSDQPMPTNRTKRGSQIGPTETLIRPDRGANRASRGANQINRVCRLCRYLGKTCSTAFLNDVLDLRTTDGSDLSKVRRSFAHCKYLADNEVEESMRCAI